jgi:membrane-bound lytic murein transglycosylase B
VAIKQTLTQRALALAMAIALITTLAAASVLTEAATHPADSAGSIDGSNSLWPLLVADQTPLRLPARGAGAADTTAADPAAAGAPSSAKLTGTGSVPATALAAYRKAAAAIAVSDPSCHLTWPLLAGIGKVESDHGRSWGAAAHVTKSGEVVPTILGPILDGSHDTATLLDTDGGTYDHDRRYDRAVGPMQFVPATWRALGRDGNGDGIKDPNNLWDATLAAGDYLCGANRDLADAADRRAAILSYNPSSAYVAAVLAWAAAYQKAGANLPALEGVPDPLVLGSGGELGEDPFGDAIGDGGEYTSYADGSVPDESFGNAGLTSDASLAAVAGNPVTVQSAKPSTSIASIKSPAPKPTRSSASPNSSPTPSPTPSLTQSPTPTPWQTPSPSPWQSPSGSPSPSLTATPSFSATPSPTPDPTPTATPTQTQTAPACYPGISVQGAASATPVDWNGDSVFDALRVSVPVLVPIAGNYTAGVRLTDANGWRVTSTVATVGLASGTQNLVLDLAGGDIGDAGSSGGMSVRVTVRGEGAAASCATALVAGAGIGSVNAASYSGWSTSVARLRNRLDNAISVGRVTGDAAAALPPALNTPNPQSPDLFHFRFVLMSVQSVTAEERARLDSLATRLMSQGGDSSADPSSYNDDLDPGWDGVG